MITITPNLNVVDAARQYTHEGLRVIPTEPDSKKPLGPYKDKPRITEDEVEVAFGCDGCGVAVLNGAESKGLCDVDYDWREAALVGENLLGSPSFARPGSAGGHKLFFCDEAV